MTKINQLKLNSPETFRKFSSRIENKKKKLWEKIKSIHEEGKTLYAYGASATSTTLMYHFGLGKEIKALFDDNEAKFGTLSPGFNIPVLASDQIYEKHPDYIIILAWRYWAPIVKKHHKFLQKGGQFILPLPEFKIIKGFKK